MVQKEWNISIQGIRESNILSEGEIKPVKGG
jgi:hypothetical protein